MICVAIQIAVINHYISMLGSKGDSMVTQNQLVVSFPHLHGFFHRTCYFMY